jgi:predicted outer membrane protein
MKPNTPSTSHRPLRLAAASFLASAVTLVLVAQPADTTPQAQPPNTGQRAGAQQMSAEEFAREAAKSGQKEIQLAELAARNSENSEVKQFANTVKQDHSEANRKLRQIAQQKGINLPDHTQSPDRELFRGSSVRDESRAGDVVPKAGERTAPSPLPGIDDPNRTDRTDRTDRADRTDRTIPPDRIDHADPIERQSGDPRRPDDRENVRDLAPADVQTFERLRSLSGEEFDREFAKTMVQNHQKSIQKFENAAQTLQDSELKEFAQNTLPKLREHHRRAQELARAVGSQLDDPTSTRR